jgi:hypothetical protein
VEDFSSHRGEDLQNVKLELQGKRLTINVDDRKYRFIEYGLDVHTMRAMLRGQVEGFKRGVCFIFDANEGTMVPMAGDTKRIRGFEASETRGLLARYTLPENYGIEEESKLTREGRWKTPQFLERIRIEKDGPMEKSHPFEIDDVLFEYSRQRRSAPKNMRAEIGDVGENLGAALITKLGWTEVERHPFDIRGPGREWYKHGTDSLFRSPETNELFLFEFRWWQNSRAADKKTVLRVIERQGDESVHDKWGKISGAFVAIVDLDKSAKVGELRVRRAW